MSEFESSNLAQVCDNCGARHPEEKSCVKFWQSYAMEKLDQVVELRAALLDAITFGKAEILISEENGKIKITNMYKK